MKKLIIVFSKFLLITSLIYCVVIIGLYNFNIKIFNTNIPEKIEKTFGFTARKFDEIEKIKNLDILVLGSSLATRNYDSRVIRKNNYQSFNLGTSSQKPNMTYIIAKKYLDKVKTNFVIVDVNPYLMMTPEHSETVNAIMNSPNSSYDFELFKSVPNLISLNALIIKYTGFAETGRLEKLKDSITAKKDIYINGGFVSSELVYDEKIKTPDIHIANFEPLQNQVEAMDQLIGFLKSKNINYILVLSPINKHYFLKKSQITAEQFQKLGRTYFSKYGNYIDSNDLMEYDKTDFMDFSHLNETGAKKFTNSLIPILKSKNLK